MDGEGSDNQKCELRKVLLLAGYTFEDLNDPEIRAIVIEVFTKFKNEGVSDDTAVFDLRMSNFDHKKKKRDVEQTTDRVSGRREGVKRLTRTQLEEKKTRDTELEKNYEQ
jgi:hypothetical protein